MASAGNRQIRSRQSDGDGEVMGSAVVLERDSTP